MCCCRSISQWQRLRLNEELKWNQVLRTMKSNDYSHCLCFLCCIFDLWWIFCAFLFPGELHCCRLDGRSSVSSNVQLGFWRTVWEHVCSGWKPFSIRRGNQITQPTHSKFPTLINLLKIPNHYIPKPHNRSCSSDGLVPHPAHPDYFLWKSLHL